MMDIFVICGKFIFHTGSYLVESEGYMTIQERLDFLDCCRFAVASVAASSAAVAVRTGVGIAGGDDLLRVGIVLPEDTVRPSDGDLL